VSDRPARSNLAVGRELVRRGAVPWGRFGLATLLGVSASLATVGLLASSGAVVGRAALRPGLGAIAGLLALVEVLAVVRAPLRYGERLVAHDAALRALGGWRVWLYDRLEPLSPAGLGGWRRGDILARAIDDVDTLQDLYLRILAPAVVGVVAAALAVVIVGLLLPAAALVLGAALLVALVGPPLLSSRARTTGEREAVLRGELAAETVDLVTGSAELLAFGRADDALGRVAATEDRLARLARRRTLVAGAAAALITVCVGAAVTGVLAVGVEALRRGDLPAVQLAVLPLAALGAFEAVPGLSFAVFRSGDVLTAGRRLLALEELPVPVTDPASPTSLPDGCPAVDLRDARLRYGPDRPFALDGVDLSLAPGGRLALVGPSGAGKSSVVAALLRFWPLTSGQAELAEIPLEQLTQADVRRTLGLLDQDADLFAGSIASNVRLGRPGANDEQIHRAVTLAQLDGWVATLPDGLETPVGERGAQLSGGQRQRVALARVLLCETPVLMLDEPTVGLDDGTATRLLADVLEAAGDRSVLLVTHRESELSSFDAVVVLDGGRVVARRD
jgi:ATP-binding cassette, subfamily C, bacterial CydC